MNTILNSISQDEKNKSFVTIYKDGAEFDIKISDFIGAPSSPYQVYTAKVDMASGNATVFQNTLGATITWTISSGSIGTGTVGALIGKNNVYVQVTSNTSSSEPKIVSGAFSPSPWEVTIKQIDNSGTLDNTQQVYVEIRVYN